MLTDKPAFPAFDQWARMSEREQDALLMRIENARRRKRTLYWALAAVALVATAWALLPRLL
jgi:hypothetical protein